MVLSPFQPRALFSLPGEESLARGRGDGLHTGCRDRVVFGFSFVFWEIVTVPDD